jgi:hypothetical protein
MHRHQPENIWLAGWLAGLQCAGMRATEGSHPKSPKKIKNGATNDGDHNETKRRARNNSYSAATSISP